MQWIDVDRSGNAALTILWAEDDEQQLQNIKRFVSELCADVRIVWARDGMEVKEFATDVRHAGRRSMIPDLIVLDINMPGLDGRLALQYLITNPDFRSVPKAFFSSSQSPMDTFFSNRYNVPLFHKSAEPEACKKGIAEILKWHNSLSGKQISFAAQ